MSNKPPAARACAGANGYGRLNDPGTHELVGLNHVAVAPTEFGAFAHDVRPIARLRRPGKTRACDVRGGANALNSSLRRRHLRGDVRATHDLRLML